MTTNDTGGVYILRGIDRDLWREVRIRAIKEGISIRALLLELLQAYVKSGGRR